MKKTLSNKRKLNSPAAKAFRKVRLQSVSALKKKADRVVSLHVRRLHADSIGNATCYTCPKVAPWQELQCGHFISRNNSNTRYDIENLRVQCPGCNIWGRGKYNVFAARLMDELGHAKFRKLLERGRQTHQFTRQELTDIITKYTTK